MPCRAARRPDGSDPRAIGSKRRVRIRAVRHGENDAFAGLVAAANQHRRRRDAEDRDHRPPTVSRCEPPWLEAPPKAELKLALVGDGGDLLVRADGVVPGPKLLLMLTTFVWLNMLNPSAITSTRCREPKLSVRDRRRSSVVVPHVCAAIALGPARHPVGVAADAERAIVDGRVVVEIDARLRVERQRARVREDVADLHAEERATDRRAGSVAERAAHHEPVTLIVVRRPLVGEDVRVVLRRLKERVARIVERLRERVRDARAAPRSRPCQQRERQPVGPRVAERIVLADVAEVRVRPAEVRDAERRWPAPRSASAR